MGEGEKTGKRDARWKRVSELVTRAPRTLSFWILLAVSLALIGLSTLPSPNTLVAASIRTETVELTVSNPDSAAFTMAKARLLAGNDGSEVCVENLTIRPQSRTRIYVTRPRNGDATIVIDGTSTYEATGAASKTSPFLQATVSAQGACAVDIGLRLPLNGNATIGIAETGSRSVGETSLVISEGELTIYGRATPSILGIPVEWLKPIPMEGDRLYLANEFRLPAGSQLGSDTAEWWGYIDIDFDGAPGMAFEGSTNAKSLSLVAPAPRAVRSVAASADALAADTISMTFGARLGNDPNLRWFFASVSFIMFFVSVIFQVIRTRDEL